VIYFCKRKRTLLSSIVGSLILSRLLFFFIDDPEGPNLLVVIIMAGIIYFLSSAILHVLKPFTLGVNRVLKMFLAQVVVAVIIYSSLY
jgi:hypothetical protein